MEELVSPNRTRIHSWYFCSECNGIFIYNLLVCVASVGVHLTSKFVKQILIKKTKKPRKKTKLEEKKKKEKSKS